ncbi:hypothetical protein U1Q18_028499 [Sarracenia purpurea var. burkii]
MPHVTGVGSHTPFKHHSTLPTWLACAKTSPTLSLSIIKALASNLPAILNAIVSWCKKNHHPYGDDDDGNDYVPAPCWEDYVPAPCWEGDGDDDDDDDDDDGDYNYAPAASVGGDNDDNG